MTDVVGFNKSNFWVKSKEKVAIDPDSRIGVLRILFQ